MSVFMLPERQTGGQIIANAVGQGFGGGLSQGIGQFLERKQNIQTASSLADQLGLKSDEKQGFIQTFGSIPSKDQLGAYEQFAKAQERMQTQQLIQSLMQPEQEQAQQFSQEQPGGMQMQGEMPQEMQAIQGMQQAPTEAAPARPPQMKQLNEKQLQALSLNKNLKPFVETELALRKEKAKLASEQAGRHFEIARETLKSNAAKAEQIPQKESALTSLEDAIKSRNLGFFSPDNIAELTGIEGLRSPEGALFKTASKEFFMGNLSRVGAKGLNQWLEKQISDMSQKIGRSTEANLVVTEALKTDLDVEKKQVELTNRIAQEQMEKYGYPRMDLSQEVMKELAPYAVEKQKELKSKIEDIKERYSPSNEKGYLMRDPSGNLRRVSKADFKAARKAGYKEAR